MANDLKPSSPTEELVRQIAMDVGKQVVAHIDQSWPEVYEAVLSAKSFRLSIRNCVHNEIMNAVRAADEGRIEQMFESHDKARRHLRRLQRQAGTYTE